MPTELSPFPCNACGKCCHRVNQSEITTFLDSGDGTCRHFDDASKLCAIYAERPIVCRVEDYYTMHLSDKITWKKFVQLNVEICTKLQQEA